VLWLLTWARSQSRSKLRILQPICSGQALVDTGATRPFARRGARGPWHSVNRASPRSLIEGRDRSAGRIRLDGRSARYVSSARMERRLCSATTLELFNMAVDR
jgi:hypothetical protein